MTRSYSLHTTSACRIYTHGLAQVSGFILGGFGAGSMIFNVVASNLANPDALAPIKGEFSSGIISKFPMVGDFMWMEAFTEPHAPTLSI